MERLLLRLFDIREGEMRRSLLMTLHIFLVISSLMIIKPVSNSLFLAKFGAAQLPYVFVLVSVFAAVAVSLYTASLKKIQLGYLMTRTCLVVIGMLLLLRFHLQFEFLEGYALYVLYVWVAVFGLVLTSQFWILANLVFNVREARRLFGFIGTGAIIGGIFGGYLTTLLAPIMGTKDLIFVCMGFVFLCLPIIKAMEKEGVSVHPHGTVPPKRIEHGADRPLSLILHSRHLTLLAGIVGISVLVAKLVEYQYSAIASARITDEDQLTAFFGFWFSNLNIASLLIQLFATRRVVGALGVGTSLFFLPAGICLGALGVLAHPALWSAVFIKMSDGSLKQSLNRAGVELLALPIPVEIKNQAKSFIDVFVDSFASGIGGVLLIVVISWLGFSVRIISLMIFSFIIIWFHLAVRVRREYIQSFRAKIEQVKETPAESQVDFAKESVFGGLIGVLEGTDKGQILEVLKTVREVHNARLLPCFRKLIHHPCPKIRLEVLRNVYFYKKADFRAEATELVRDPDPEIKDEALRYLFARSGKDRIPILMSYLDHEDHAIRQAALLCAARESRNNQRLATTFDIRNRVETALRDLRQVQDKEEREMTKVTCATVIGVANIKELYPYLHLLLNDPSPAVVKAAIVSAGQSHNRTLIPVLIQSLENEELRDAARDALIHYGMDIIETMIAHMGNQDEDLNVRLSVPNILSSIGVQKSVNLLIRNLEQGDPRLRYEILRALNRLKTNFPNLKFDRHSIARRVLKETDGYMRTLTALYAETTNRQTGSGEPEGVETKEARRLLIGALEERLDNDLERIFRLLGLRYAPEDMYNAYLGLRSDRPDLRVNALEFLDNVLEVNLKKVIIPIVESTLVNTVIEEMLERFNLRIPSEFECLAMLLTGEDNLLRECALVLVSRLKDPRYFPYICESLNSMDPALRKAARVALEEIGVLQTGPEAREADRIWQDGDGSTL